MSLLAEKRNFTIKIIIIFFHWLNYQLRGILKKICLKSLLPEKLVIFSIQFVPIGVQFKRTHQTELIFAFILNNMDPIITKTRKNRLLRLKITTMEHDRNLLV